MIDRRGIAALLVAGATILPGAVLRDSPVICPFRRVTGLLTQSLCTKKPWASASTPMEKIIPTSPRP